MREVSVAVFVVSSTGDGDPPENCDRFTHQVQRRSQPSQLLRHLRYTVCGEQEGEESGGEASRAPVAQH